MAEDQLHLLPPAGYYYVVDVNECPTQCVATFGGAIVNTRGDEAIEDVLWYRRLHRILARAGRSMPFASTGFYWMRVGDTWLTELTFVHGGKLVALPVIDLCIKDIDGVLTPIAELTDEDTWFNLTTHRMVVVEEEGEYVITFRHETSVYSD